MSLPELRRPILRSKPRRVTTVIMGGFEARSALGRVARGVTGRLLPAAPGRRSSCSPLRESRRANRPFTLRDRHHVPRVKSRPLSRPALAQETDMSLPFKPSRRDPLVKTAEESTIELTEQELTRVCGGRKAG